MAVHKQSVSFTYTGFAFACDREQARFETELQHRLALPVEQWEPMTGLAAFTVETRAALRMRAGSGADDAR